MQFLLALLILAVVQMLGFAGMFWVHKRMMDRQYETIRMLAIFKKAADTNDIGHMIDLTQDPEVKAAEASRITIEQEDALLPDELPSEALASIRAQMTPKVREQL